MWTSELFDCPLTMSAPVLSPPGASASRLSQTSLGLPGSFLGMFVAIILTRPSFHTTLIVAHHKTPTQILHLFCCKPCDANYHVQASEFAVLSQSQARQANSEQIQLGASISVVC